MKNMKNIIRGVVAAILFFLFAGTSEATSTNSATTNFFNYSSNLSCQVSYWQAGVFGGSNIYYDSNVYSVGPGGSWQGTIQWDNSGTNMAPFWRFKGSGDSDWTRTWIICVTALDTVGIGAYPGFKINTYIFTNQSAETITVGCWQYPANPNDPLPELTHYYYYTLATLKPGQGWSGTAFNAGSAINNNAYSLVYWSFKSGNTWHYLTKNVESVYNNYFYTGNTNVGITDPYAKMGDPIDAINGGVDNGSTDIAIPCPGIPLVFSRAYNSAFDNCGALGYRWSHSYECFLYNTNLYQQSATNSYRVLQTGDGQRYNFQYADTNYTAPVGVNYRLLKLTNGGDQLIMPAGIAYNFDSNGVLQTISDACQNQVTLTYTNSYPSNQLVRVDHNNGQYLTFTYQSNRLTQVNTPTNTFYMTFAYNGQGELTNATRNITGKAFTTTYLYDGTTNFWNHSLTQSVNAVGDVFNYYYATNSSGQTTSKGIGMCVSSNWYQDAVSYDTNACKTTVTFSRGNTNQVYNYYYNTFTQKVYRIEGANSANVFTKFDYSTAGDLTRTIVADMNVSASNINLQSFDAFHNVTNSAFGYCAAPSNNWAYSWDTNLTLLTSVTDPETHMTGFEYNNALISKVKLFYDASNSYNTTFAYTTNGLLAALTNANGHVVQYGYDQYGFQTSSVPQAGPVTTYQYSQLGVLQKISLPSNNQDTNGNPVARDTVFASDELGRINSITYLDTNNFGMVLSESFYYDGMNNVTNHVDTGGRSTFFSYLPSGKLASITKPCNGTNLTTSFAYDQQFNTLKVTDAKGRNVETYQLDIQDRVTSVTNLEGQGMSVVYTVGNKVKSISRFDGTVVSNYYNVDGLLTNITYPGITNRYSYYKNALLKTASNTVCTISNNYNFANRLTDVKVTGLIAKTQTISYAIDPVGNTTNMISVAGNQSRTFDAGERLSSITATRTNLSPLAFNMTYDSVNGLISTITCTNNGISLSYARDDLNRITGMTWGTSSNCLKSFSYSYNNAGMATGCAFENGERNAYSYDDLDRLTMEVKTDSSGSTIYSETNSYDQVGNRISKVRDGNSVAYTYSNGCNRLTGWGATSTNLTTTIDVIGSASTNIALNSHWGQLWVSNKVSVVPSVSGTNFWSYGLSMNLGTQKITAAIRDVAGNTRFITNTIFLTVITNANYSYATNGCVTNIAYAGTQYSKNIGLTWNGQYQLTAVATNGVAAERNGYDALGRRVWSWDSSMGTGNASTNFYIYDGANMIADVDSTGGVKRAYVYAGLDFPLAMVCYTGTTAKTYFYITDHLGSVHAIADESGTIVESYRYDAWGRILGVYNGSGIPLTESAIGNRYLWQGREYSFKTGLYYFRNRWYDPTVGRWLSPDPAGIAGGLNMYMAFNDNGVNFVDPFGLRDVDVYIWSATFPYIAGEGRVGHAMITEHGHSDQVLLSQFPKEARHFISGNDPKTFAQTMALEGSVPDHIYVVHVPDDKAFDDEVCKQKCRGKWCAYPMTKNQTHCTRSAYDALKAGGVPVSGQDDGKYLPEQVVPGTLGDILQALTQQQGQSWSVHRRF